MQHYMQKDIAMASPCGELISDETLAKGSELINAEGSGATASEDIEDIAAELGLPITEYIGDAPVLGTLDEDLLARPLHLSWSKSAKNNAISDWTKSETLGDLADIVADHRSGKKDGSALLQGRALGSVRKATAMASMDLIGIDLDLGDPLASILRKLASKGLMAIVYSTHSHGKTTTEIKRDALVKFAGDLSEFPHAVAVSYLMTERGYDRAIAESARIEATTRTPEGTVVQISHDPIPKFRVLIPLRKSFIFAERSGTDQQAIAEWKDRYVAAAEYLDFDYDKSCTDPSRLLYLPRHPKGATNYVTAIIAGKPLDFEMLRIERAQPTKQKRREVGLGSNCGARVRTPASKIKEHVCQTPGIERFVVRDGPSFDVLSFADDHLEVRSQKDGKREAKCPNDAEHSNPDDPEDRAFCVFDGSEAGAGFQMRCQHSHCAHLDRLAHLDLLCQKKGLTVADLRSYVDNERVDAERVAGHADGRRTIDELTEYAEEIDDFDRLLKRLMLGREDGYIGKYVERDNGKHFQPIGFELLPIARSRDENGRSAAVLLGFFDQGGRWQEVIVPSADVHSNPRHVRRTLVDMQFQVYAKSASDFDNLMTALSPKREIVVTERPGWHSNLFLTPGGEMVGDTSIEHRLARPWKNARKGTLEGQLKAFAAALRSGIDHFAIGILFGCVGTMVARAETDNALGVLVGETSRGKSTAQRLGASVWGSVAAGEGCLHLCRTTDNRLEIDAERANGTFLALDELKMLRDGDLQNVIFMLREGRGKGRMTTDASAKPVATWRTGFLLSSERTIEHIVTRAGDSLLPGATVRIMEVDVSNADQCSRDVMNTIDSVSAHFGHVGPRFAEYVASHTNPDDLRASIAAHQIALAGAEASTIQRRAAYTLAALWETGRIMKAANLIPADVEIDVTIHRVWEAQRQSLVNRLDPVEEAICKLQENLASRKGLDVIEILNQDEYRTRPVVAWYEDAETQGMNPNEVSGCPTYYVATDKVLELSGDTVTLQTIRKRLKELGFLIEAEGKNKAWDRVPGLRGGGKWRNYRLRFNA
ncbi:DUF927 domain-containing protein [Aurantimonas coralicida]|uniref:DUF927 domain-containing protein n=1 Tax=Aurantimonas coralicida TaxID=182270 RepID=UPI001E564974|nr:DUF927 domain-containing protein [Aurantimonas coralicida]MCD1644527.1 DUF927 domain-containing protein [Aurantimonas coralicida]